jgi:uncharacterized RDD family membrane protein YckC
MTTNSEQIDWGHWIIRLIALIIDGIILAIVSAIIGAILAIAAWFGGGFGYFFGGIGFLFFWLIWGILAVLYYTILDTSWGATIGKRIMGLQVQMVNGGKVSLEKALIRNISKIYPLLLLLDWLIGIVTPGDKRQKFSDRYAGTIVVQTRQSSFTTAPQTPPPPPPPPPPT